MGSVILSVLLYRREELCTLKVRGILKARALFRPVKNNTGGTVEGVF